VFILRQAREGALADKSTAIVVAALSRAIADPQGLALFTRKEGAGLFSGTSGGRLAAQRAKDDGYIQVVRTEKRGKNLDEFCAITEKGVAYLLSQVSPKQVLEDFIRSLETKQGQTGELLANVQHMRQAIDSLKRTAERVLEEVRLPKTPAPEQVHTNWTFSANGDHAGEKDLLHLLTRWNESGASEDYPLPALYRQLREVRPQLSIGQFHDELRQLHEQEQIYLHPWTGPLYAIPEPPYALLVGHEVAYYASLRKGT
jgi:hypothetical protein